VNLDAEGSVVSENGPCMVYSGGNGPGQVVSNVCCGHAIRLAQAHGVGFVTVRESNHFGAAAFWAQKIARADLMAIVMCNASPIVAPWQGREKRLGTNPICVALPGMVDDGWLLDMATTTVAMGKIFKAHFSGYSTIPQGWALDNTGTPTTDTAAAMQGMPMPLGGYKGYGLEMLVEILCAVLSGGAMSTELGGIRFRDRPAGVGQVFIAVDVARFMPLDVFQARMRTLIGLMKSSEPAPGYEEVLVAGDPEWSAVAERRVTGIPLTVGVWNELGRVAERYGVVPPALD
jgi:LDH2 family malate/lactate/ureidoglycolate dehydrogenase